MDYLSLQAKVLNTLHTHNIPIEQWGTGGSKTINHLVKEVEEGETELVVDSETGVLLRKFSFLAITVFYKNQNEIYRLVEEKQVFSDGRERVRNLDSSIGEKIKYGESNINSVIQRALLEELGITNVSNISDIEKIEEDADSQSYPGLRSRRIRFNTVVYIDESQYNPLGYTEVQEDKVTYFKWVRVS